jgi:hypothetical protein
VGSTSAESSVPTAVKPLSRIFADRGNAPIFDLGADLSRKFTGVKYSVVTHTGFALFDTIPNSI